MECGGGQQVAFSEGGEMLWDFYWNSDLDINQAIPLQQAYPYAFVLAQVVHIFSFQIQILRCHKVLLS
jgi:hypothetical protein